MFGFLLGTLCLIGLVRVVTHRHWGHGRFRRHHGGYGPRYALHRVLERLDAAPGQEKVITAAVSDFMDRARESGREVRNTRRAVAEALRGDQVDEAKLGQVFAEHDAALERVRRASVTALQKVHEALDERQRRILGDLFESDFHGFGRHGYGHHC
jgi:Spy/CpxP family protein refolding chaperone